MTEKTKRAIAMAKLRARLKSEGLVDFRVMVTNGQRLQLQSLLNKLRNK